MVETVPGMVSLFSRMLFSSGSEEYSCSLSPAFWRLVYR